ncbi:MAG TPA: UTP--glucose-1-phosphate uridylyltransferase GalU [Gammaproteobacteria bacterium]|nr:UTP--glucose-1-phosphate uridylyltransferase GalU [Gammaproteobacteria bacterium]
MVQNIRKAVFPVAGLGTRFLPATKASPKEMLPVVDKPLIQYAAEEAVAAGAKVLIFVTGRNKTSIPDHFDRAYELENELQLRGKEAQLRMVQDMLPDDVQCVYVRQPEALGLGHAVLCAEPVVGREPFFVVLPDDLIDDGNRGVLTQMRDVYNERGSSLVGVQQVSREETSSYGIIDSEPAGERLFKMSGMVEKPQPDDAPSDLGVVGRYLLTPRIFDLLRQTGKGAGGEIQLTDAIAALLNEEAVYGFQFEGTRYDCGNKLGYLMATVKYGLAHPELGDGFREFLQSVR